MKNIQTIDVEVLARHGFDAKITPIAIKLINGQRFAIDEIIDVREGPNPRKGGRALRYQCIIRGKEATLVCDIARTKWYCEV